MSYLVFSQAADVRAEEADLVRKARAYFRIELRFTERHYGETSARYRIELGEAEGAFVRALTRRAEEADWVRADRAEIAGRATGMALLARRCRVVWELVEGSERDRLTIAAMLAATYLGPVLPEDGSTLYGVRGARERLERLSQG